jgi:hypothetical protein
MRNIFDEDLLGKVGVDSSVKASNPVMIEIKEEM